MIRTVTVMILFFNVLNPFHNALLLQKTWTTLKFRVPTWTSLDGAKGILNGETLSLPTPGVNLLLS